MMVSIRGPIRIKCPDPIAPGVRYPRAAVTRHWIGNAACQTIEECQRDYNCRGVEREHLSDCYNRASAEFVAVGG